MARGKGLFIAMAGLAGAASGVVVFLLSARVFDNIPLRAVTGGFAAFVLPLILVLLYYPWLISGTDKDQDDR